MKKRSRAGGEPIKGRRRKTPEPKRRNAPRAVPRSKSSKSSPPGEEKVARLTRERDEALEQQTATGDVLKIISRPSFDLQAVLDTLIKLAARLCEADLVAIHRPRDGAMQFAANFGLPQEWVEIIKRTSIVPGRGTATGRVLLTGKAVQIADVEADPEYTFSEGQRAGGFRTVLAVPLEREGETIGVIVLCRTKVHPFTDKQIDLVQNFAAQAVIAIENARLLDELRQRTSDLTERTADLTEALEQQTAMSEVLQVISSSPGVLQPVFATMLEKAVVICEAGFGDIYRWEGDALRLVANHNTPPAFAEERKRSQYVRPVPGRPGTSIIGLMLATKSVVHVADLSAEQAYIERRNPTYAAAVELGGVRTILLVPMLKENELIGAFILCRQEVRPFTDKQIALVTNFAAQAVIAIENARLLNELRQRTNDLTERTADLTEALEQQTATSEVLRVISGSPGDLQPVFASMLGNAVRICDAKFGNIYRWDGDALRLAAAHNTPAADAEHRRRLPLRLNQMPESLRRMVAAREPIQVEDILALADDVKKRNPVLVEAAELGGIRTVLNVPMLKEDQLVGAFIVSRQEVRPFTEKQIALVQNFAAQAVIAIENARLLNELRQRTDDLSETLEQQTASAKVLEVISRSAFDLHAVFETVAESSVRLCEADRAFIFRYDGELLRMKTFYNASPELADWVREHPVRPGNHLASARAALHRQTIHIPDVQVDPDYLHGGKLVDAFRTVLAVPVLKSDDLLGVILIYRLDVQPFTAKQIALVETFADQAAIAIENTRLLQELQQRTDEVMNLNQQLEQRVTDQVDEIERMSRLRRFLPPQVADLIVASGSEKQLESHRREITALFCDLRGFTGFTESADAEDVMALLRDYHAAIGEIIIKHNGTLERYAGDGVMVVFNDPVPVENPALQAVLMALELRDALGALTATWSRLGHDIGFGIGIAHGFATLGTIGYEGRFDYAAIGTVSNVASRLCDEAKPGQILISPRVLTKVENAVKVEPVGEFELKGIRRPLAAYNVVAAV
jgi:GAF domain-containing protein